MPEVTEERVSIEAGALRLEGALSYLQDEEPARAVLLLPPHPHFAGNLDNNVIRRLAADLAAAGIAVLRFNYRGVGESDIVLPGGGSAFEYWSRVEEEKLYDPIVEDTLAVVRYLSRAVDVDSRRISLVGYSFGAIVAGLVACRTSDVAGIVAIAPPLRRYSFDFLRGCEVPQAFFFSTNDFLYDQRDVAELRGTLGEDLRTSMVTADDHFFRGFEADLANEVLEHLQETPNEP
jgi:alpha/beta superfamily hydrolase